MILQRPAYQIRTRMDSTTARRARRGGDRRRLVVTQPIPTGGWRKSRTRAAGRGKGDRREGLVSRAGEIAGWGGADAAETFAGGDQERAQTGQGGVWCDSGAAGGGGAVECSSIDEIVMVGDRQL